jgi:2-polyprenyl-3-methyl-5-hydroxy-6-metoxy-1,4-benzoquinol methylase
LAVFDPFADSYSDLVTKSVRVTGESSDYFAEYKARFLARVLAGSAVKRILDYGCGVGSLARHLVTQFPLASIDGFDPSVESILKIDDSVRGRGSYVSSSQELGSDYDLIVLANVLHHVKPTKRQAIFGETFSRLAPGGRLVVLEHNPFNPLTRWAVSQCAFDADAILLSSAETRRLFQMAGFKVARRDFIVFFPRWLAFLRRLEPLLHWCPSGAQYAILGIKGEISSAPEPKSP